MQDKWGHKLSTNALTYWQWLGFITSLFFWLLPIIYIFFVKYIYWPKWPIFIIIPICIAITLFKTIIIPKIIWNRWRYDVSEHDINLEYGLWIKKHTIIPMVRVQHVDTKQGPLMSRFALSSVSISTAAGSHEIPALEEVVADELRNRISILARVVEEDV